MSITIVVFPEVGKNYISAQWNPEKLNMLSVEGVLMVSCHFKIAEEYEVLVVEETSIDRMDGS